MPFLSARSVSNEGLFFMAQPDENNASASPAIACRSISRGFSRSSVGGDELSMSQVAPDLMFAGDILEHVEETLSKANSEICTISRNSSRCLDPVGEAQEWESAWGLEPNKAITIGFGSRSNSMAGLSRSNSIIISRPSSVLGKRSFSAGFMFACDHPYDVQDGMNLKAVPEFESETPTVSSPDTSSECTDVEADSSEKTNGMDTLLGDVDFSYDHEHSASDAGEMASGHGIKAAGAKRRRVRRRVVASSSDATDTLRDPLDEQRAALTLKLLHGVARTEAGRTLLGLACNSNKKCRFSFSEPESIPAALREQVLARVTYDPSIKGTANRSEHTLPARDNMPPMIESLCSAGLLEGFSACTTEVSQTEAGCVLRMTCVLDGEHVTWDRKACTSCGSCFSRFMYEDNKYAEFRKITKDITAGHRDWSGVAGQTLCEPCYRHFTKYGHLNNPRRVALDSLSDILQNAAQSSTAAGPQAKSRPRRGAARR